MPGVQYMFLESPGAYTASNIFRIDCFMSLGSPGVTERLRLSSMQPSRTMPFSGSQVGTPLVMERTFLKLPE
ncbi:hypothetical protein TRAPUB_4980 [Trametes pubescens]|uniref:Uncharacterized protein n=1 Tax=Trametes pubescens TaxID=154538 RepID=A0A1M2V9W6_TRAPU|nr:hypothetical protein TRAPUB_4980 [Trametes pubescens]